MKKESLTKQMKVVVLLIGSVAFAAMWMLSQVADEKKEAGSLQKIREVAADPDAPIKFDERLGEFQLVYTSKEEEGEGEGEGVRNRPRCNRLERVPSNGALASAWMEKLQKG